MRFHGLLNGLGDLSEYPSLSFQEGSKEAGKERVFDVKHVQEGSPPTHAPHQSQCLKTSQGIIRGLMAKSSKPGQLTPAGAVRCLGEHAEQG
jgi:hypothetical protein